MDFKKLFRKDDKAVSPVIGVILMVAITVILAAAIGSSVFSHGVTKSAPQANLNIKSEGIDSTTGSDTLGAAVLKIEHTGGDTINFDKTVTKVMVSVNGGTAVQTEVPDLTTLGVGDIGKLPLVTAKTGGGYDPILDKTDSKIESGDTVNIKIIDIQTSQVFLDRNVRV